MLGVARDSAMIKALLTAAEEEAATMGDTEPGAEHLLAAALLGDDRSGANAFAACGRDIDDLRRAIQASHRSALDGVGISVDRESAPSPISPPKWGVYRSKSSMRDLLRATMHAKKQHRVGRLRAAHVLIGAAALEHGTTPRALRSLGISDDQLRTAAVSHLDHPG